MLAQNSPKIDFDRLQAPSPRESMYSELLLELDKNDIPSSLDGLGHNFEFAAWLKLKHTHDLPVLLIMEQKTANGERWFLVDSARVTSFKGMVLMSGRVETKERIIQSLQLHVCHPNPEMTVQVEELRFNGNLVRKDYLDSVATGSH